MKFRDVEIELLSLLTFISDLSFPFPSLRV
jgi:ubiquitin-large subunit ribosomal protein L40e